MLFPPLRPHPSEKWRRALSHQLFSTKLVLSNPQTWEKPRFRRETLQQQKEGRGLSSLGTLSHFLSWTLLAVGHLRWVPSLSLSFLICDKGNVNICFVGTDENGMNENVCSPSTVLCIWLIKYLFCFPLGEQL